MKRMDDTTALNIIGAILAVAAVVIWTFNLVQFASL